MKYFLTGATGFVGGHIAQQLVEKGHQVVALVRNPSKAQHLQDVGVNLAVGDVSDRESMRLPMTGVDGVFHVAGWYKLGTKDKSEGEKINIQGTRNVLELMRELGIPKGVYTSTLAVNSDTRGQLVDETYHFNGKHLTEYDRTKAIAHDIAKQMMADGLPLVIVMPGLIYGPGDTSSVRTTFVQYLQRQLPMIPQKTAFCWAHVDDIAQAHILAMERGKPQETYIIAGEKYALTAAMQIAEEITGIPQPMSVPPVIFQIMSNLVGLVENWVPIPPAYAAESLRILTGVTYIGDNSKAKRDLGYNPRSLKAGLTETLNAEMKLLNL